MQNCSAEEMVAVYVGLLFHEERDFISQESLLHCDDLCVTQGILASRTSWIAHLNSPFPRNPMTNLNLTAPAPEVQRNLSSLPPLFQHLLELVKAHRSSIDTSLYFGAGSWTPTHRLVIRMQSRCRRRFACRRAERRRRWRQAMGGVRWTDCERVTRTMLQRWVRFCYTDVLVDKKLQLRCFGDYCATETAVARWRHRLVKRILLHRALSAADRSSNRPPFGTSSPDAPPDTMMLCTALGLSMRIGCVACTKKQQRTLRYLANSMLEMLPTNILVQRIADRLSVTPRPRFLNDADVMLMASASLTVLKGQIAECTTTTDDDVLVDLCRGVCDWVELARRNRRVYEYLFCTRRCVLCAPPPSPPPPLSPLSPLSPPSPPSPPPPLSPLSPPPSPPSPSPSRLRLSPSP